MRVLVTGEQGFIAKNLPKSFEKVGGLVVDTSESPLTRIDSGEICVHRNTSEEWADLFVNLDIDVVVHNAAKVGTDVVALDHTESTLTNVDGTYNIVVAANLAKIPVCYTGTTVIYDTPRYQNEAITENSIQAPNTLYGALKQTGETIIKTQAKEWLIVRPLFAYGGIGDMNSLIAKSFYSHLKRRSKLDMFLDPSKKKDYLHVEDFCDAVAMACHQGLTGDYNIAAETPCTVGDIVEEMSGVCGADLNYMIKWHPETDYLGNHILSSEKFRNLTEWTPNFTLAQGIKKSWRSIVANVGDASYNPLRYLDEADEKGIDLTKFF